MKRAESTFSLKDQLFNTEKVEYLASQISAVYPDFSRGDFHRQVVSAFPSLELKERIAHITECLEAYLPDAYTVAMNVLLNALPQELDPTKTDDDFGDFIIAPISHFVARYGCTKEYLDPSLMALREITKRFSAEDAIRYFINAFPDESITFLEDCAVDANYHVRRLASEGTRPKLPWCQKLTIGHTRPIPILDKLFADPTRYVTRSVANHLNDISKIDPKLAIDTLERWQSSRTQDEREMAFIIKHSLRTLVKQGYPDALSLMGFGGKPEIDVLEFSTSTPRVQVGNAFEFSLDLRSNEKQRLLVDYVMLFASDGRKQGRKVFKLKQLSAKKGEMIRIKKKHPMRLMTTRRLTAGEHQITLQINGQAFGTLCFELLDR